MQEQVDCFLIAPVGRSWPWYTGTPINAYRVSSAIASGSENPEAPKDKQDSSPLLPEKIPVSCLEAAQSSNMVVLGKAGVAGVVGKGLIFSLQL